MNATIDPALALEGGYPLLTAPQVFSDQSQGSVNPFRIRVFTSGLYSSLDRGRALIIKTSFYCRHPFFMCARHADNVAEFQDRG
jgi:hypothetical protein